MREFFFTSIQTGLQCGVDQVLLAGGATPQYASAAAAQFSAVFTKSLQPGVRFSLRAIYLLGACTVLSIVSWILWLLTLIHRRNLRTVSMLIGCTFQVILESVS